MLACGYDSVDNGVAGLLGHDPGDAHLQDLGG